ncbi:UNVERIFIED_CONTAM: hypothetical protein LK11_03935, partial [Mumia flava]
MDLDDAIAVVGVAANVPGASDVDAFWMNLARGVESVTVLSDEQLRDHGVPEERLADPAYVKAAAMVEDAAGFDADLFGMTAREAQACDPQIRLFLEAAHAAIESAGYDPTTISAGTGVFASSGAPLYHEHHLRPQADAAGFPLSGLVTLNHGGYIATMASYTLDLHGPSVTVQTACSSTLVAVHLACQSLRTGDCDTAIVGGASIDFPLGHGYLWSDGGVQSRSGHCRPFDADADGTVFGAGACAVVLKPLADALADHDHVRAVIRGSAVNNDGADKVSFGAPSAAAQRAVVMEALSVADVDPGEISYVETHGTGTVVGDPIEVRALADAFTGLADEPLPAGNCAIGSVKGNIGHLGPVAGLAGFIKTVLALEHEQLPASINVRAPNPRLDLPSTPFRIQDRLATWARDPQRPRRAAVTSTGIGGANAHVVLEEAPPRATSRHEEEPRLVVWSGPTLDAEREVRAELAESFVQQGEATFADAVATLQHGRQTHSVRAAAVCTSAHDGAATLREDDGERIVVSRQPVTDAPSVCLLFPGQGSQQVTMARGLYRRVPVFAHALDEWLERLDSPDLRLRECWLGNAGLDITDTARAQPLLFAVELALAHLWQRAGVRPAALLGHSLGELSAATVAGIFEPDDAASVVLARGAAMRDHAAGGGMLAAAVGADAVDDLLAGTVTVAVINRDDQVVLSGSDDDLADVAAELTDRGVACTRLPTSGAFHTPLLRDAAVAFGKAFDGVSLAPPSLPVYSAASGRLISAEEAVEPAFWLDQLTEPVRFATAFDALVETPPGVLLEVGPGQVLTDLARRHPHVRDGSVDVVPTLPRRSGTAAGDPDEDVVAALAAAARLWTAGTDLSWEALGQSPLRHRVPLPGYPYQRARHWVDAPAAPATPSTAAPVVQAPAPAPRPAAAAEPATPFSMISWLPSAGGPPHLTRAGTTAVVFLPADDVRADDVLAALERAEVRTVPVRATPSSGQEGPDLVARPGNAADVRRVFDELADRGTDVDLIVHATAAAPWSPASTATVDEQLEASFFDVLAVVQHGLRTGATGRAPELVALTSGAVDVSGAEAVDPVKASIHGLVRTLAAELPWQRCKVVDVSATTPVDELREELCRTDEHGVVALRGRHRWVPVETPLQVAPSRPSILRSGGVYVLTGGMGGLGLTIARGLAATGTRPRIALLGRRVPPDGEPVDTWSAEVADAVTEATSRGAEVRLLSCDVGDPRDVRRALDVVAATLGPVRGLLHLAGVAGDGILQVRDPQRAAEVLRPKVRGTFALAEALADRAPLDWVALFSSRAAVDGLVGSGDYAAANAVLERCASVDLFPAERVLSIGYPSWTTVGMASRPGGASGVGELRRTTRLAAEDTWALDEHRLDGTPVLPGTATLDLVVRAAAQTLPSDDDQALVLSDVAFVAPLVARQARRVDVVLVAEDGRHRFEVRSQPEHDTTAPWVTHATGGVGRRAAEPATCDLAALREATRPVTEPGPGRFSLGPRWDSVHEVRDGEHERLVGLRLSAPFAADLDAHPLHPALLDLATSAARGCPGPGPADDPDEPYVPFHYRSLTVFAPLQAEVVAHVRSQGVRPGHLVADVDVFGTDGRILVAVEGFTMRRVDRDAFADGLDATSADSPEPVGIDPEVGIDMLMTLLASRTPENVIVRPHRGGRPVPLSGSESPAAPAVPRPVTPPAPAVPAAPAADAPAVTAPAASPPAAAPPAAAPPASTPPAAEPARSTSDRLRELWAHTLGNDRIELDDDF